MEGSAKFSGICRFIQSRVNWEVETFFFTWALKILKLLLERRGYFKVRYSMNSLLKIWKWQLVLATDFRNSLFSKCEHQFQYYYQMYQNDIWWNLRYCWRVLSLTYLTVGRVRNRSDRKWIASPHLNTSTNLHKLSIIFQLSSYLQERTFSQKQTTYQSREIYNKE